MRATRETRSVGHKEDRLREFPDILTMLCHHSEATPEALAIVDCLGTELTYGALFEKVERLATNLNQIQSARPGGRIRTAIVLPNGAGNSVALLAAAVAGEAAPLNPQLTAIEFERIFEHASIEQVLVSDGETGASVLVAKKMQIPIVRIGKDFDTTKSTTGFYKSPGPTDIALVLLTSGSTGTPKIVPLSHKNVCCSAHNVAVSVALTPADTCLTMWEQFHVGGLVDLLLAPLTSGGRIVATEGFNAANFFDLAQQFEPTWFQGVPTSLGEIVTNIQGPNQQAAMRSFRFIRSVAAALPPAQMARLEKAFGVPIICTLGMTEAGPLITSTALPPATRKPGSVGQPAGPEVAVFDANGKHLKQGDTGEVGVRGDNVFAGYENAPESDALAFQNGWFLTGDLGFFDPDGDLFITGRKKEQINRGGFKISPAEVEEVLSSYPEINDVAVFSVPHPTLLEDVVAAVTSGKPIETKVLRAFLSDRLAPYKVPARILVFDAMPRNPVGKIDKLALAETASERFGTDSSVPSNPTETFLAELWRKELHVQTVGANTDFLAAGGDSLSAMRILLSIEKALGRSVPDGIGSSPLC